MISQILLVPAAITLAVLIKRFFSSLEEGRDRAAAMVKIAGGSKR